ncbi:threonine/serine exporter family protein [Kitasatospora sp. NBC_01250]|uniref:threonine/serine ThrE exporter family protein n=1 Tax=unclassified Kitasatospora TaxID=2633591 RepID=UPI002E0FABD1|nr:MULTISPECIES: threonine/serine exporter family protein [unclassified Kitasatospora]WSJ67958.1 threonine/serine exporter family protein [Kitasatospora sp. NBC_01302]
MPKRGRPGGSRSARGGKSANRGGNGADRTGNRPQDRPEAAPKPVPPAQAPPTEGLLANAAPPADQVQLIPLAPLPQETEGLLGPTVETPAPLSPAEPAAKAKEKEKQDGVPPEDTVESQYPDEFAAFAELGGGSEDTLTPEVWRAVGYNPPSGAIPTLRQGAPGAAPWPDRMRTLLRTPMSERPAFERTPREAKSEATARNVPRILDLTLRIGELLLASGESAEDVEAAMLGVSHAYQLDRCEPQVTFTLISISYQPSLVEAPVTAARVVRRRTSDYTRLAAVYRLVADITAEKITVNDAYRRLALIRRNRHPYPTWLLTLTAGLLAGAATFLVGGRIDAKAWLVFLNAVVAAIIGDRLAILVARRGLPEFYQFVLAAMPAAVCGIILSLNSSSLRGSVVITGGLFALLPGRALVAAVQDGLTGFYITAAARLLEVVYLVAGIVIGVMLVLYAGVSYDAQLRPAESLSGIYNPPIQLVAAMLLTLFFAMLLQTSRRTLALVTFNSGIGWTVYGVLAYNAQISPIVATGIAAGLVGLFGQLMARFRYASALPYVTAALGPLMPGSALYLGMLSFAQGHPSAGLVSISRAAAIAMALAIGVNLGGEVARLFMKVPGVGTLAGGEVRLVPYLTGPRRAAKRTRGF